ncbi:MAG: leucyl aminopeptidase family protein [Candidatus Micrarchaeia archaeon]
MKVYLVKKARNDAKFVFGKREKKLSARMDGKNIVVELGERKDFCDDDLRKAVAVAYRFAKSQDIYELNIIPPRILKPDRETELFAEALYLADYSFSMKSEKEKESEFFAYIDVDVGYAQVLKRAEILTASQNYARSLANLPPLIATPEFFANEAKKFANEFGMAVKIYDKKQIEKMGMNGILAVSRGSINPPVLIEISYLPKNAKKHISLVGKGLTFDSGGLDIKNAEQMEDMKLDKTGACIIFGVLRAVAKLKLPIKISAVIPFTENMPGGNAMKPGDIIKMYNGKTVEILNTDAEGRLILADALAFANEKKPDGIVDVATLTGAISVALGSHAIGMFSTSDELTCKFMDAGEKTHERVWLMPLFREYGEMMRSDFADLKNISGKKEAGACTAAAFLKEFVSVPWVHLDVAGVYNIKENQPYFNKGAPGIGVRLIAEVVRKI